MADDIRFISHSCISITVADSTLLCDPWFFGRVFEDSWCHVLEPDPDGIDYSKLRYIWISHEHPDHLHFPTLKLIHDKLDHPVKVLYRRQYGKKVAGALEKTGFEVILLDEDTWYTLDGIGEVNLQSHHYDAALLIRTPSTTILNMNDCPLSMRTCRRIRDFADRIDYLFLQFSLAGYHANDDDTGGMEKARRRHLATSRKYVGFFQPTWYVPFASFINFCTPYNEFMNRWRVSLADVERVVNYKGLQLVYNGDVLLNDTDAVVERNAANLIRWEDTISNQDLELTAREPATEQELETTAAEFVTSFADWPRHSLPRSITIHLLDIDRSLRLDFRAATANLESGQHAEAAASLSSRSCIALMTTPWGADTLNISAELRVHNLRLWRWLLFCKHYAYKPVVAQRLGLYIPRAYSWFKTIRGR